MARVQYAHVVGKRCPMHDPACAAKVAEHVARTRVQPFTVDDAMALLEQACGRYTRGQHKGQLRGWATIRVCTVGGWLRTAMGGHVVLPGTLIGVHVYAYDGRCYFSEGQ